MCLGVTAFASGTSELTNLLQTYDQQNARLHEKVIILNRIYRDYCLPLQLYENVKKSLHQQFKHDIDELIQFTDQLPQDLKVDVTYFIFEKTFKELEFF